MKDLRFSNQIKTGGRLILLLAILILNFAGGGVKKAYAVTCYTLTIIVSGGGTVNASPAPPDFNCGTQYTSGTVVTLTASPNANNNFVTWTGALTGTINPNTVTMTSNKSVTAIFAVIPANNDFTNATVINSLPYSDTLDMRGADTGVNEGNPISCTNGLGVLGDVNGIHSVWYKYTADLSAPPTSIVLDTIGSDFDTFIAVWTDTFVPLGDPGSSSCNDDTFNNSQSSFTFTAIAGNTYYIEIGAASNTVKGSLIFHAYTGTSITVKIGGTTQGVYDLTIGQSQVVKYPVDGVVEISSTNGTNIVASLNQWRRPGPTAGWSGVAQSMALPVGLITNQYVIPRYNGTDLTLYNAVLMANVDTVPRDITVKIGTTVMGTYTLQPSASLYKVYNITGGPVVVSSDVGAKIIASLYELKRAVAGTPWNGQNEMMGMPWEQLSDKYLIPLYFGSPSYTSLDAKLYIANADAVARDITVKIGTTVMGTYTLQPGTSQVLKYPVDGAVEISSVAGSKIAASLNQWRRPGPASGWTGVAQSMALPVGLISSQYVIPRYNGTDPTLYNAVLMANVDTVPRDITVKIGTTVMGTYTLQPSASLYKVYNIVAGPVVVSSAPGSKIIASLYELKRAVANTPWTGQSEMMGMPWEQLSDKYLIPLYFGSPTYTSLDAKLYIGVP